MSLEPAPIFDAALSLPESLRADLAARLIASLDGPPPSVRDRSPEEWASILKERSDAIDRGDTILLDGGKVLVAARGCVNTVR